MGIIVFNNKSSKDVGLEVETFPEYIAPERIYDVIHVPGRNGDVVIDTGTYGNVPRTYEVSIATYDYASYSQKMSQVVEWLHSASGYARLEDSYDEDFYRLAYYNEQVDIQNLFNEAGKATINFVCKPQRYYKSGEIPIVFTNTGKILNETIHPAYPLLNIAITNTLPAGGSDIVGEVYIGSHAFSIKYDTNRQSGATYIMTVDCELQNAYNSVENMNDLIVLNGDDMPTIDPGEQEISFEGSITSVEVIPRWWTV